MTREAWLFGLTSDNAHCRAGEPDGDSESEEKQVDPVTRATVLLHFRGRFTVLHSYLAHVHFNDGKGTTTQTGEHTIHRIERPMAGEDAADFIFMLADTMERRSGTEGEGGDDQMIENWECSWIDLKTRSLRKVSEDELARLREAGEAVSARCGKMQVDGRSPHEHMEEEYENEGPGCRLRDPENPCSMDEDLRNED